jgi:ABC-type oligopeptide transport system ATPase subunit
MVLRTSEGGKAERMVEEPLLRVEHLTTTFDSDAGPVAAVNDVSFDIHAGETLGLVGESGSGKSVTALSILRLVQPPGRVAAGRVLLSGRDLMALDERAMREVRGASIALIFQEPMTALNAVFRVGNQIAEAMLVHGRASKREARAQAIELLRKVRIPNPEATVDDYPHQLSGGMRQRVMIAIALACRPSLVIADEPTTALDVTIQAQILDLLREMKSAFNLSLLLITHDLGVIAETADPWRDVRGTDRRNRPGTGDSAIAPASLHARSARIDTGRCPGTAIARDRRLGAAARPSAPWLRVQSALPGSLRTVYLRATARLCRRTRPVGKMLPAPPAADDQ